MLIGETVEQCLRRYRNLLRMQQEHVHGLEELQPKLKHLEGFEQALSEAYEELERCKTRYNNAKRGIYE